jgi:hypothetical protein
LKICIFTRTVVLVLFLFAARASGQQASNPPFDFPAHVDVPGEKSDEARYRDMVRRNNERSPGQGPAAEPRVLKKGPLAPAEEDRTAYAGFLKQTGTGLVRLLPRPISAEKVAKRPTIAGGGQRYSFFFLSHEFGDIELTFETFCQGIVGGPPLCQYPRRLRAGHYGMLTNLGDVALDELTINDPRTAFLLAYKPPREASKVRCEWLEFSKGVTTNGQLYKTGLPIRVNSTYLLRSTDRKLSDVLVAFRVVREDVDGSVTLAWKLLKEFQPTKIENVLYVNGTDKCPCQVVPGVGAPRLMSDKL